MRIILLLNLVDTIADMAARINAMGTSNLQANWKLLRYEKVSQIFLDSERVIKVKIKKEIWKNKRSSIFLFFIFLNNIIDITNIIS